MEGLLPKKSEDSFGWGCVWFPWHLEEAACEFRNTPKPNQNYLERFWPSVPTYWSGAGREVETKRETVGVAGETGHWEWGQLQSSTGPMDQVFAQQPAASEIGRRVWKARCTLALAFLKLHSWLVFGTHDVTCVLFVLLFPVALVYLQNDEVNIAENCFGMSHPCFVDVSSYLFSL